MVLDQYKKVFKHAWQWWGEDQVPRLSAALTFYAMLSLAPMLLLAVTTAAFLYGEASARESLLATLKESWGGAQETFLQSLLQPPKAGGGAITTVLGIAVLIFGASGLFEQLRDSVNAIWGLAAPQGGFLTIVRRKVLGIIGVVLGSVGVLAWMFLDARIQWLSSHTVNEALPLWKALSFLVSWAFAAVVLAAMFKLMPRKRILWSDVWLPAVFTALAFSIGKYLLSLYFAMASISAGYGAAGALVVILVWIYYSGQILFFGVELSNAYAYDFGSLKGQPHDSEKKVTVTGAVAECGPEDPPQKCEDPKGTSHKTSTSESMEAGETVYDQHVPAPSLTASLAGLSQSLGHLGQSFGDLGKSFTGRKRKAA
jgi:membrane protein